MILYVPNLFIKCLGFLIRYYTNPSAHPQSLTRVLNVKRRKQEILCYQKQQTAKAENVRRHRLILACVVRLVLQQIFSYVLISKFTVLDDHVT